MVRFAAGIFFLTFFFQLKGQSPVADFSLKPSACKNELIEFANQSSNSTNYEWDFCLDDIKNLAQSINLINVNGLSWGAGYKLVQENGNWYGFVTSINNNRFFRLDFGNDPGNTPTVYDYGNLSGQLLLPYGLEIVFNQGEWFGFISSYDFNAGVTVLYFGNSLINTPSVSNIGRFNLSCRFTEVKSVVQGTDNYLVLVGADIRSIVTVNFGDSYHNTVQAQNVFSTGILPNVINPFGLDVINKDGNWIVFAANTSANEIAKINFGANLQATPTVDWTTSSIIPSPVKVKILQEGSGYYAIVSAQSQSIAVIDCNDLTNVVAPQAVAEPTLPSFYGFDAIRWKGKSIVHGVNDFNSSVSYLKFENSCSASNNYSTAVTPAAIYYSNSGTEKIELVSTNPSGERSVIGKAINILTPTAADISFSTNGYICSGSFVDFTSQNQSGNISGYSWTYGDGAVGSGATSQHAFATGNYTVRLDIVDNNGCTNFSKQNISIYNIPQANFTLPAANPFCTNQSYTFTNTSTYDNGSSPTWQWSANGVPVSVSQNLNYAFTSSTAQTITLDVSLPGCTATTSQNISTIQVGPQLSFTSPSSGCVNNSIVFSNTSSGTVLGYNWDYGDGNSAPSQTNGSNTYATNGNFMVTLSASNAAGCQNSFSKSIPVYLKPQPDFSIDLPPFSCAGSASQFNDLTPGLPDSNLATWSWQFGDAANGTSQSRNPKYTYPVAADYSVTLQVTSNFGCNASVQKTVTISPSPQPVFTTSPACVNQLTNFTDATTGVKSRQWKVQGNVLPTSSPTPSYTFLSSASFPVTLTVTGNNNCINSITQNVIVPVPPALDFSVFYPCSGSQSEFLETSAGGSDPATAWNWNFTNGSGSGSPAHYSFLSSGLFPVTLTSTRQSKCVYSLTKNVSIMDGPVASFTPSLNSGAAPLDVSFTNTSSFANFFNWSFGDADNTGVSTATLDPVTFTYTQLGTYTAVLVASNSFSCRDTATAFINVVVPIVDAALNSLTLVNDPQTTSLRAIVSISNKSNVPLVDPLVNIDLGGNVSLKEKVIGTIEAGSSLLKALSLQIIPGQTTYICVKLNVAGDVFDDNDAQCVSLIPEEIVLPPSPNPATTEVSVNWIAPAEENINVIVFKSNGQVAFEEELGVPEGLSQFKINTSSWGNGLYLIQVSGARSQKMYKVVIAN